MINKIMQFINKVTLDQNVFILINDTKVDVFKEKGCVYVWNLNEFPISLKKHIDDSIREIKLFDFIEDVLPGVEENNLTLSVNYNLDGKHNVICPVNLRKDILFKLSKSIGLEDLSNELFSPNSKIIEFLSNVKKTNQIYVIQFNETIYSEESSLQEDAYAMLLWSNYNGAEKYMKSINVDGKIGAISLNDFVINTMPLLMQNLMLIGFDWNEERIGPERYSEDVYEFLSFISKN